jgi:hypothetical protein
MKDKPVYALRFGEEEGDFYAVGPQGGIGGGPVAYHDRERADALAEGIGAIVVERTMQHMIYMCQEAGWVLWIKQPDGTLRYVSETVGQDRGSKKK